MDSDEAGGKAASGTCYCTAYSFESDGGVKDDPLLQERRRSRPQFSVAPGGDLAWRQLSVAPGASGPKRAWRLLF